MEYWFKEGKHPNNNWGFFATSTPAWLLVKVTLRVPFLPSDDPPYFILHINDGIYFEGYKIYDASKEIPLTKDAFRQTIVQHLTRENGDFYIPTLEILNWVWWKVHALFYSMPGNLSLLYAPRDTTDKDHTYYLFRHWVLNNLFCADLSTKRVDNLLHEYHYYAESYYETKCRPFLTAEDAVLALAPLVESNWLEFIPLLTIEHSYYQPSRHAYYQVR